MDMDILIRKIRGSRVEGMSDTSGSLLLLGVASLSGSVVVGVR